MARRRRAYWSAAQEQRALDVPHERESMDILEVMLRLDQVSALAALDAIMTDAHRGWLEIVLEARAHHVRWGIANRWRQVVMLCASGAMHADADLIEALDAMRACDNDRGASILRSSSTKTPARRRRSPAHLSRKGFSCPVMLPLARRNAS